MSIAAAPAPAHVQTSLSLWDDLTADYGPRAFALRVWDGTVAGPDAGRPARFTVALEHPGALRQMFWPFNKISLGEAYIYGDFDVAGDVHAFLRLLQHLLNRPWGIRQ